MHRFRQDQLTVTVPGSVSGRALVLDAPMSLLCLRPEDGRIDDPRHPQFGVSVTGKVLVLPYTIGGPASAGKLAECLRCGTGPAALLSNHREIAASVASTVTELLYGVRLPSYAAGEMGFGSIRTGDEVEIDA